MKILASSDHIFSQHPDSTTFQNKRQEVLSFHYPREDVFHLLKKYNESIGNDVAAHHSLEQFKHPESICVITGQQLGLMGGPAYTVLKAITALLVARENQAIPIFWLATEDHDSAEIDHTFLLDPKGNLKRFRLTWPKIKAFVEDLTLNASHIQTIQEFLEAVHFPETLASWRYQEGMSYCQVMANFLVRLFAGTGLVFVEPRVLRPLAQDFFFKEMKMSDAILKTLQQNTQKIIAAEGEAVLSFEEGTNLFLKMENSSRRKIRKQGESFVVDKHHFTLSELTNLLEKQPERFSTNVAARPVFQSLLLPTLAYVAGPTEKKYYEQLVDYHHFHHVPYPLVIPRASVTIITPTAADLMEKCHLKLDDAIPASWRQWQLRFPHLDHHQLSSNALHYLGNLLMPHHTLQERVLNWYEFQRTVSKNLISTCLSSLDWRVNQHYRLVLEG